MPEERPPLYFFPHGKILLNRAAFRFPRSMKGSPAVTDCRGSWGSPTGLPQYFPILCKLSTGSVKRERFTLGKHFQGANISLLLSRGL